MITKFAVSLPLAFVLTSSLPAAGATPSFDGKWESFACELRPQTGLDGKVAPWFLKRSITINGAKIEMVFTTFADAACKQPLHQMDFGGTLSIGKPSAVAEGAVEAEIAVDGYARIKPMAQGFVDFLASAGEGKCGKERWKLNVAQDIAHRVARCWVCRQVTL